MYTHQVYLVQVSIASIHLPRSWDYTIEHIHISTSHLIVWDRISIHLVKPSGARVSDHHSYRQILTIFNGNQHLIHMVPMFYMLMHLHMSWNWNFWKPKSAMLKTFSIKPILYFGQKSQIFQSHSRLNKV